MQKKITVKEIKEIEPKAEVYELNKQCKYIVMIKKSPLAGGDMVAKQKASVIMNCLSQMEIPAMVLIGVDDDVQFMEIS